MATGAGGRSYLRASHADREQVIDLLKAAFVQGRLAKDEFDLRVGRVLASRTYADLCTLVRFGGRQSVCGWKRKCPPPNPPYEYL